MRNTTRGGPAFRAAVIVVILMVAGFASAQTPAGGAAAQEGPAEATRETESGLIPPALIGFSEASYPAEAFAAGRSATVELALSIDARGIVTDATVLVSGGDDFDEAALAAVRRFVFDPAFRDGEAIAARIGYRYVFELSDASTAAEAPGEPDGPETPATGRLAGQLLSRETDTPLVGTEVVLVAEDGTGFRTETDEAGAFLFDELAPGRYEASIGAPGLDPFSSQETIEADQETAVTYRLAAERADIGFRARAVVDAPPREVVRRRITRDELLRVPGTRGDALRTIELLPGVGRPPFGTGQILIRGAGPNDSAIFLDGIRLPLLYHFGGLTSVFNSQLLEQIDFVPGNFSVRYGRLTGGIVEVETRDPALDALHGVADVNIIDASLLIEAPISDEISFAAAGRRSYIDFWFENVIPEDAFDVVTAPVYYDYQAALSYHPEGGDRLRFMVYGSSDRFNAVFSEPSDSDPNLRGDLELQTQFHRLFIGWDRELSRNVTQQVQFSVGPTLLNFGFGEDVRFDATFWDMVLRSEWRARIAPRVQLRSGVDIDFIPFSLEYRGPPIAQSEGTGQQDPITGQETLSLEETGLVLRPGLYTEVDLRPIDPLRIVLGMRLDWYSEIDAWSVDPRLVSIVSVDDDNRIKFGAGLFSQPPEFQESAEDLGNPNLRPLHALHLALGYEHDFEDGIRAGMELFYKHLWDRVVQDTPENGGGFVNEGVGQIYGLELSARIEPQGRRYFGFLSYTFSRSERRDLLGTPWRLFDFDQTHILSASFTYLLGDGWELGGTFRLVSGNPQTPAESFGRLNLNTGLVTAINGEINSERAPFFHRLDVRIAKRWEFEDWNFTLYLDVQNSYNSTNPEALLYDWRYVNRTEVPGLPIIPSLGIRGEL